MKKKYFSPKTVVLGYKTEAVLYYTSLEYGGSNNDNPDDAKGTDLAIEELEEEEMEPKSKFMSYEFPKKFTSAWDK